MEDERTVDELIQIADEMPERFGLAEGMSGLRATAAGEQVSVTVDVQGMLVGLEIGEQALRQAPEVLAAEISRLSAEAGDAVLRKGIDALREGTTPAIAEVIRQELGISEEPAKPEAPGASTSDAPAEVLADVPAAAGTSAPAAAPKRPRRPSPPDDEEEFFTLQRM